MSFINDIIKSSGNKYATIASDGIGGSDVTGFIDTGSYTFNALVSGSLYGGIPNNKIIALAGESATGKTFFAIGMVKQFLDNNKDAVVLYFDTEQAVTSDMFSSRGIDSKRVAIFPVATVEDFRNQMITIADKYLEQDEAKRKPMLVVLDSLGMLSTTKEMSDTAEGKETKDMTRAQVVKSTFRVLTLKLGYAGIPLILTNHTYESMGMFPTKEMSGGSGVKYAASTIVYLSKRKDKNAEGEVVGNIIHCKLHKGRFTKENKMVDVKLNYDSGLDKYYGLVEIAVKYEIFKKVSTRIEMPTGDKAFESQIIKTPEKYFTPEVMERLEAAVKKEFCYGSESAATTNEE